LKWAALQLRGSLFLCLRHSQRYEVIMRFSTYALLISAALMLTVTACGPADSDPGPGGVTAGDAEALDAAAKKLDERDKLGAEEAAK
jgi:hypothetical protein